MDQDDSNLSHSFSLGDNEVDIEIHRKHGGHSWQLDLKLNGMLLDTPQVFVTDQAAFNHAIVVLKQMGFSPDALVADAYGIIDSPLSQSILVEGHPFDIKIFRCVNDPEWHLEIVNAKGTSIVPEERYKSDQDALGAAISDFENEPIEVFLG